MELHEMKELTGTQFDAARLAAERRAALRVGDRPRRADYRREYGALWGALDALAALIFAAALAISSVHILAYAGHEAAASFDRVQGAPLLGLAVEGAAYGVIHQLGFILLAESAMLLFFVLYRTGRGVERWLSLALALAAMIFVVVANLSSGLNLFLALLAPAFTIGIGFRLEALIAEKLRRAREVDARYRAALEVWEAASADITRHPDYRALLAQEVWAKLMAQRANAGYVDAPPALKRAAVQRELAKDAWAVEVEAPIQAAPQARLSAAAAPEVEAVEAAPLAGARANGRH